MTKTAELPPGVTKPHPLRKWIRIHLLSRHLLKTRQCKKVLDLACGWGFYLEINPGAEGVDINEDCIAYLKKQGYLVQQCDIKGRLPFADAVFDLVLAHDVLEHFTLSETEKILGEVWRVLKNGGEFMVIVPNRKGYLYGLATGCGHKHFITPQEIKEVSREQFQTVRVYSYPLPQGLGRFFTHNKEVVILKK